MSRILAALHFQQHIGMTSTTFPAAKLLGAQRMKLAIQAMTGSAKISRLASQNNVSRKFVYQQKNLALEAITDAFAPAAAEDEILFYLPVTKAWLRQVVLALTLICHSSYRGVVEFMRDILGVSISVGSVHSLHQLSAQRAGAINTTQNLSQIRVGLHDEIFHCNEPVLVGVDAHSTYCYLLSAAEHRDADTWAIHLLYACDQGFNPDYLVADQGTGLRAGQAIVWKDKPCHGDVFHILQQCESLANVLASVAQGATTRCQEMEVKMDAAKEEGVGCTLARQLGRARFAQIQASILAKDVKTLTQWLRRDVLELAGPSLAIRLELFDFVADELRSREHLDKKRIGKVRVALQNQRNDLLAFAGVLDGKLEAIAQTHELPMSVVRQACVLQRKSETSPTYWEGWCRLCAQMGNKCHAVFEAVLQAMEQTPRCSSMVENLNSRLRNYFTLRRQLGGEYLGLLQFFLNHRTFLRSRVPERVGKSPKQLMTGQAHAHWLTLLGFGQPQPLRA
jgi:hypothetical protein